MDKLLSAFSDFTETEDALIGRAVRAFGLLERSLGLLVNANAHLIGDPEVADPEHKKAKVHVRDLGGGLGEHANFLDDHTSTLSQRHAIPVDLIEQLADEVADLAKWRNLVCHGVWSRASKGELFCFLWSRNAIKLLREVGNTHHVRPDSETFTQVSLREMISSTLAVAEKVNALLHDTRQQASLVNDVDIATAKRP